MVTLGCARNEVDSEELAARLEDGGWQLADDAGEADVVLVNTCGFIQAAKQESIDELLDAAAGGAQVVAAGCLAERYGSGLAEAMPEAQILSFDDYADIAARLDSVAAGERWAAHEPRDRRRLLPLSPAATAGHSVRPAPRPRRRHRRPAVRGCARVGAAGARASASVAAWLLRSRSPRAATGAARSARFRPSAARSCPAARPTWWLRQAGLPTTAPANCCWSARTRPPTARTWETSGCWRSCCRSSPRSLASAGSG